MNIPKIHILGLMYLDLVRKIVKNKPDEKSKDDSKNCGIPVRVRHYTSANRAKAVIAPGQITPGERYRVYLEMVSSRPLTP